MPPSSTELIRGLVDANRRGQRVGLCSICSANRFVLEAGMLQARRDDGLVCIESTSNQVNQSGGYTGMTPAAFRDFVADVAADIGVPRERVILGGDHLGPYPWRHEPAATAMAKARELVRDCVLAGYTKIHLDASMRCGDDPGDREMPLDPELATARTVELCRAAEAARAELPAASAAPVYVIGTEVPAPGGERAGSAGPAVTDVRELERTVTLARDAFSHDDLESAWERVVAVVVQPGVDFDDETVYEYGRARAEELSRAVLQHPHLVYEAHSTDYQTPTALHELVEDHFAILKVGPALTFALREAVFALECIERELLGDVALSDVRAALEDAMLAHPEDWRPYYHDDEAQLRRRRAFGYSDRIRYAWPRLQVQGALSRLLDNLARTAIPATLLSQYLPDQYVAVRNGLVADEPVALIRHRILEALEPYARACGARGTHPAS